MPRINRDDTAEEIDRHTAKGLVILRHQLKSARHRGEARRLENASRLPGNAPQRHGMCPAPPNAFPGPATSQPAPPASPCPVLSGAGAHSPHPMRCEAEPNADRGWDAGAVEIALAREDVARAIAEIEDAAEALRWEEPSDRLVDEEGEPPNRPWVWLRVGGMWASIGAAAAAMLAALALLMR
jgi:hypothetical protein